MTEENDNPLERILDELIVESGEGAPPPRDSADRPEEGKPRKDSADGATLRAVRFLADDAVIKEILTDMAELSHEELDALNSARSGSGEFKGLDQVARETGFIGLDQQEAVFRAFLERRVDEMKEKLVGAQIGSYSIVDEIGRGGMGIVFKARQESPMFTREVALKFMLAGSETEKRDRERFVSEVKGLAGLSHPFLVPIFDSGIEGDLYYFSMELIDGRPLSDASIADELSTERKVEIVRDIARALGYLHDQGVIHRDVKPGNIMVDRHGNAKLLDFGIAQFSADPRRRVAQAGTPFYMAPEVIDPGGPFGPIGPGTDIYALGAVLYKLLTGREVFPYEDDVTEVFRKTLKEEPAFSTTRRRIVHPDLERILRRCLRKRVDERYPRARKLADDLDRFLRRSRFRIAHFVGAAVIVVASAFAVGVALREPPPSRPQPTAAELAAAAKEKAETKVRQLRVKLALETFDLSGDVEEWLLPGLEELDELASAAGEPGDTKRLEAAIADFRTEAAKKLKKKAREAMTSLRSAKYFDDQNRSWIEGAQSFFEAEKMGASTSALHGYLVALDRFGRVEKEVEGARRLEEDRTQAEDADDLSDRARRFLENEDLRAISPRADELFAQGEKARKEAKRFLLTGKYEQARVAFLRAKRLYEKSKVAFDKDHRGFVEKKLELRHATERFLVEFNTWRDLYLANVSESFKTQVDTVSQESQNAFTKIDAAKSFTELGRREHRLELWQKVAEKAKGEFEAARRQAEKNRKVAAEYLNRASRRRFPATRTCGELIEQGKKYLRTAEEAFEKQEFRRANEAYMNFGRAYVSIWKGFNELKAGMQWIDGRQIGERYVSGFWMDELEISVAEYRNYLEDVPSARRPPNWEEQRNTPDRPVVGVSYEMALAFAEHYGKSLPDVDQHRLALPYVRDSALFDAAEWLRPRPGTERERSGNWIEIAEIVPGRSRPDDVGFLTHRKTTMIPQRDVSPYTFENLAGFRCVLQARSWEETAP